MCIQQLRHFLYAHTHTYIHAYIQASVLTSVCIQQLRGFHPLLPIDFPQASTLAAIIHNYPISELTILIHMHGLDTYSAGTYTHLHACMYVCVIYLHGLHRHFVGTLCMYVYVCMYVSSITTQSPN